MKENEIKNKIEELVIDIYRNGPCNQDVLCELSYYKYAYPQIFFEYEKRIIKYMGLFYKKIVFDDFDFDTPFMLFDEGIFELYKKHFTPTQAEIKAYILSKPYFMFSAPTSSGKSFLLKDLLLDVENDIVIIVPTRALLNEYINDIQNDLYKRKIRNYNVLSFIEKINTKHTNHNIFVLTPERAFEIFNSNNLIDLFIFDEAQLVDFNENVRSLKYRALLNKINKIYPNAKKLYAYPFVDNLKEIQNSIYPNDQKDNFKFYNYQNVGQMFIYKTKTNKFHIFDRKGVNKYYLNQDPIKKILSENTDGKIMIFCTKSKICNGKIYEVIGEYLSYCKKVTDNKAIEIINQVKDKIGANKTNYSKLIECMVKGLVIHHGSLPHSVRILIEKFINLGFARICIATTTLEQGVNMPFDLIYLYEMNNLNGTLDLKNLIGRAGRSTINNQIFDYGMIVTRNKELFLEKLTSKTSIDLNENIDIGDDFKDLQQALDNDDFEEIINVPKTLLDKMSNEDVMKDVKKILDLLYNNEFPAKGKKFEILTEAFRNIYRYQLNNKRELESTEKAIFTSAIKILLWKFQKKKFSEICALRYAYFKEKKFNGIKFMQIPNKHLIYKNMFKEVKEEYYYDLVVYNTYEFIDKCINLYLKDNFIAAIYLFLKKDPKNENAIKFYNFLKYGSDTYEEIMLFRYGFTDDEIEKIKPYVKSINEQEVVFYKKIKEIDVDIFNKCKYYIY